MGRARLLPAAAAIMSVLWAAVAVIQAVELPATPTARLSTAGSGGLIAVLVVWQVVYWCSWSPAFWCAFLMCVLALVLARAAAAPGTGFRTARARCRSRARDAGATLIAALAARRGTIWGTWVRSRAAHCVPPLNTHGRAIVGVINPLETRAAASGIAQATMSLAVRARASRFQAVRVWRLEQEREALCLSSCATHPDDLPSRTADGRSALHSGRSTGELPPHQANATSAPQQPSGGPHPRPRVSGTPFKASKNTLIIQNDSHPSTPNMPTPVPRCSSSSPKT